jgi:hypothetical protein
MDWILLCVLIASFGPVAAIVIVQGIEAMTVGRKSH